MLSTVHAMLRIATPRSRIVRIARLIALSVLAALATTARDARAQPWTANHGLTPAQYQSRFDSLSKQGYRLVNVSGYERGGSVRYADLWVKGSGPAWVARHGLSNAEYQAVFNDLGKQGYRLTYVNGYAVGGQDRYAAIWEKRGGPAMAARHGLTAAQYQQTFTDLTKQDFRLLHVSAYAVGGQPRYAAIFEKSGGPAWVARHGLTAAQHQDAFDDYGKQGFRLKLVSGYRLGASDFYAAIWEKSGGPPWVARHGIPDAWYQNVFDNYYYQGYRLAYVNAFTAGTGGRVNTVWVNTNFSAADLGLIAKAVKTYRDANQPPGVAFAITKDGRLVYAAGVGQALPSTGEEVGPTNLFRVASVSKPITSVAVMKLVESRKLALSDKVFGAGSILGPTYPTPAGNEKINGITVQHLLQHVSGFSNTPNDPMFQNTGLTHPQLINWVLNDSARFVTRNPGATYEYMNFGYALLGRVIEAKSGRTYETYVRDEVLKPAGVSAMVIAGNTVADRRPREVEYSPAGAYSLNVRRFDAHGGWIASPIDLVRFLVRVDGQPSKPDIISASSFTTMTTKAGINDAMGNDPNYALGWVVSPPWHNGAMTGTTAVMAVRSNGFTFAALANMRPGGDQFAGQLSKMVADIIAAVSAWPSYDLFQ